MSQNLIYRSREAVTAYRIEKQNFADVIFSLCALKLLVYYIFPLKVIEKKGITISDPDAREHVYGMPYSEWKEKYQK